MPCCCTNGDSVGDNVHVLATSSLGKPPSGRPPSNSTVSRWRRRFGTLIEWALPITTLSLVPKCPACVAAYVLLFSGVGLSLPAAAAMRWSLIAVSVAALGFLIFRTARRALTPSG
jgi:hypothetical protein